MREGVKEVSVDMWGGFPKVIREVFPKAKIVIDRFHVIKLVNKALNKIRLLLELKGLKNRYLLLKKYQELTPDEQQELKSLLAKSPCWEIAYELKEEIISFYETTTTVKMGLRKLKKRCDPSEVSSLWERAPREWLNLAQILFKETAQSLAKHSQEICHYFINQTTSGVTEGINNKIKLIIRQSYGFKTFDSLREKLLAYLFK